MARGDCPRRGGGRPTNHASLPAPQPPPTGPAGSFRLLCQVTGSFSEPDQGVFFLTPGTVPYKAKLTGIEQILVAERLGQEPDGCVLHGLDRHADVATSGDEDDGEKDVCGGEFPLKVATVLARQSDVENETARFLRLSRFHEFGHRRQDPDIESR